MKYACWLFLTFTVAGCDDDGGASADPIPDAETPDAAPPSDSDVPPAEIKPTARFELSETASETPLAHGPWPSDLYLVEGAIDLSGFPRPATSGVLESIIRALESETRGFGTSASLYMAFDGPLDVSALPADAALSLRDDARLFLVDVDPMDAASKLASRIEFVS